MVIFYFPHSFYIYYLEFYYLEVVPSPAFIHSIISLIYHGIMDFFWTITQYYHFVVAQNVPALAIGSSFKMAPISL